MSLDDIRAREQKGSDEITRMCSEAWAGINPWRWSIPANPDKDSDLVLSAPLADNRKMAAALDAVLTLHRPDDPRCTACLEQWPCTTVTRITEALG